ncbi:MAG: hypothetical protein LUE21_09360 [Oscillospiraceae bacterium]|nr:hypothetical protein [Oscillospiraceae bacterium]
MKNTVLSCIRQAVCSRRFLLGAAAVAALVFFASLETLLTDLRSEELLAYGAHGSMVVGALGSDTLIIALPIVCVLPYACSYVEDIKTGYVRQYLSRTSRRAYLTGKAAGCILSGGLVLVAGIWTAYGLSALALLPMEAAPEEGAAAPGYFMQLAGISGRFFLSGGLWAMVGMALSAGMESRYVAYAAPFILYYVLIILYERYFDWLYVLYPKGWLAPGEEWVTGPWGAALVMAELTATAALCFAAAAERRLSDL